jgi:mandelate racemase
MRACLDRGADRLRQSRRLCAACDAQLKTPIQIGENFYGPRDLHTGAAEQGLRSRDARLHAHRRRHRLAAGGGGIAGAAGIPMSTHLYPEVAAHVMRVTETAHWLEWQDWADPIWCRSLTKFAT